MLLGYDDEGRAVMISNEGTCLRDIYKFQTDLVIQVYFRMKRLISAVPF